MPRPAPPRRDRSTSRPSSDTPRAGGTRWHRHSRHAAPVLGEHQPRIQAAAAAIRAAIVAASGASLSNDTTVPADIGGIDRGDRAPRLRGRRADRHRAAAATSPPAPAWQGRTAISDMSAALGCGRPSAAHSRQRAWTAAPVAEPLHIAQRLREHRAPLGRDAAERVARGVVVVIALVGELLATACRPSPASSPDTRHATFSGSSPRAAPPRRPRRASVPNRSTSPSWCARAAVPHAALADLVDALRRHVPRAGDTRPRNCAIAVLDPRLQDRVEPRRWCRR